MSSITRKNNLGATKSACSRGLSSVLQEKKTHPRCSLVFECRKVLTYIVSLVGEVLPDWSRTPHELVYSLSSRMSALHPFRNETFQGLIIDVSKMI